MVVMFKRIQVKEAYTFRTQFAYSQNPVEIFLIL